MPEHNQARTPAPAIAPLPPASRSPSPRTEDGFASDPPTRNKYFSPARYNISPTLPAPRKARQQGAANISPAIVPGAAMRGGGPVGGLDGLLYIGQNGGDARNEAGAKQKG